MTDSTRKRWEGTSDEWAACVEPFIQSHGRLWLRYDEVRKVQQAKTVPKLILKAAPLLSILRSMSENLSFRRSTMKAALATIYSKHSYFGIASKHEKDDYLETTLNRCMNLCRVVAQGERKPHSNKWISELPWRREVTHENQPKDAKNQSEEDGADADLEEGGMRRATTTRTRKRKRKRTQTTTRATTWSKRRPTRRAAATKVVAAATAALQAGFPTPPWFQPR